MMSALQIALDSVRVLSVDIAISHQSSRALKNDMLPLATLAQLAGSLLHGKSEVNVSSDGHHTIGRHDITVSCKFLCITIWCRNHTAMMDVCPELTFSTCNVFWHTVTCFLAHHAYHYCVTLH